MHFENNSVHLGIRDGPKIKIPITSIQSNTLTVGDIEIRSTIKASNPIHNRNKIKLSTNVLHDIFQRSDGALATIRAHNLWKDIQIIPDIVFSLLLL